MVGIELNYCLLGTAIVLFHIGMLGLVLNRGNILKTIMSLELLLLSINLNSLTSLLNSYLKSWNEVWEVL